MLKRAEEEEERKRKEKAEAHLYTIIKVAREEDLSEQIGRDTYFDLVDHDKVCSFRIPKQMPFLLLKEEVAKEFGIPIQFQRFWLWAKRQNHTYRPRRQLTPEEKAQSVGQLREDGKLNDAELNLFLEVELGQGLRPILPPLTSKEDILLFFKLYDPLKEELRYVGHLFVKASGKPVDILAKLNEFAGFARDEEIKFFEEIRFEPNVMCEHVDKMLTFHGSQLQDGDIICFQKSPEVGSSEQCGYPDVPSFLEYVHDRQIRLKREQEKKERSRKEKAEAHTIIKVSRDEDLLEQIGRDVYFDLVDHDKVRSFRIPKWMPFNLFKKEVAKEFGIPMQFQRFWIWAKRRNHTFRPHHPLTPQEEAQSVGELYYSFSKVIDGELKLFLEVERGQDLRPIPLPVKSKEDILLFFKVYDPLKENLRYVGRLFVNAKGKPVEILTMLNKLAGFSPDEEIKLFEEIKFEPHVMCEHVDKMFTFGRSELEDGDIICFQKSPQVEQGRYPDVPSFLEYVHHRQVVRFRYLEKPMEDEFCLELSNLHNYDDVVKRVAGHLGLDDPSKIRLTSHNCYSQQPKPQPIKYRGVELLSDMLLHNRQTSDILYYKVLDLRLPGLQGLKTLRSSYHGTPPPQRTLRPTSGTQTTPVGDSTSRSSTQTTPVGDSTTIVGHFEDAAPDGKVRFLAYWVSPEASVLLEMIHDAHKDTFTNFSMKGQKLRTVLLESFASFIKSMSTTKVNEVNEEALSKAAISIEDFEQVGLELSWLKQRLGEAKRVSKWSDSIIFVDLCESSLVVARAKVRELEEGLEKGKAELEDWSRDLPNSLGVDDYLLKDFV